MIGKIRVDKIYEIRLKILARASDTTGARAMRVMNYSNLENLEVELIHYYSRASRGFGLSTSIDRLHP